MLQMAHSEHQSTRLYLDVPAIELPYGSALVSDAVKQAVLQRDGGRCLLCPEMDPPMLHVAHIIAKTQRADWQVKSFTFACHTFLIDKARQMIWLRQTNLCHGNFRKDNPHNLMTRTYILQCVPIQTSNDSDDIFLVCVPHHTRYDNGGFILVPSEPDLVMLIEHEKRDFQNRIDLFARDRKWAKRAAPTYDVRCLFRLLLYLL